MEWLFVNQFSLPISRNDGMSCLCPRRLAKQHVKSDCADGKFEKHRNICSALKNCSHLNSHLRAVSYNGWVPSSSDHSFRMEHISICIYGTYFWTSSGVSQATKHIWGKPWRVPSTDTYFGKVVSCAKQRHGEHTRCHTRARVEKSLISRKQ